MSDALKLTVYHGQISVGVVHGIQSLQWMPAWAEAGEAKLVCGLTPENLDLLRQWALLYLPDTPGYAAQIVAIDLNVAAWTMTVRAQFTLRLLAQRVAKGSHTITDAAGGLLALCREHLRGLPVALPQSAGFSAPCEETLEWPDLYTAATRLAAAGGFGLRMAFDRTTAAHSLEFLHPVDRTQGEACRGYLGTRMRDLADPVYSLNGKEFATVAICQGDNAVVEVGDTEATGLARRELYVDGGSVQRTYSVPQPNGTTTQQTYSEEEYLALLRSHAAAALAEHCNAQQLSATATGLHLVYGTDYALGDLLPIRVPELGLHGSARVERVKLIFEDNCRTVEPVLGDIVVAG